MPTNSTALLLQPKDAILINLSTTTTTTFLCQHWVVTSEAWNTTQSLSLQVLGSLITKYYRCLSSISLQCCEAGKWAAAVSWERKDRLSDMYKSLAWVRCWQSGMLVQWRQWNAINFGLDLAYYLQHTNFIEINHVSDWVWLYTIQSSVTYLCILYESSKLQFLKCQILTLARPVHIMFVDKCVIGSWSCVIHLHSCQKHCCCCCCYH